MHRRLTTIPFLAAVLAGLVFSGQQIAATRVAKEIAMVSSAEAGSSSKAGERLHEAVMSYDLGAVRAALAAGAPIDAKGFAGASPALIAAQISAWDICLYLLKAGADANARDETGDTIAKALAQSRVAPGTTHHEAMQAVAKLLKQRGLLD